jgi:hypothetical protein
VAYPFNEESYFFPQTILTGITSLIPGPGSDFPCFIVKRAAIDAGNVFVISRQLPPAFFTGSRSAGLEDEAIEPVFPRCRRYHLVVP